MALTERDCDETLPGPAGASMQAIRIWQIVDYIDAHLADELSVEHLAARVGLSRSHFVKQFEKETGETPGEFIRRQRLERAANFLLHDRSTPLLEVALACGFQSAAVFSRSFHDWFELSPSAWRQGEHWRRCGQGICWRSRCRNCQPFSAELAASPQLQAMRKHPFARGKPDSIRLDEANLIELPDLDMVYLRGHNTAAIGGWLPLWQRWAGWANSQRLIPDGIQGIALQHLDNANIVEKPRSRADIGLLIDPATPTPAGLARKHLRCGRFLLVPFQGNWLDEVLAHEYGWLTAFAAMGLRFDMHRASFKFFAQTGQGGSALPDLSQGQEFAMRYAFAVE